jgi:hypothetical protein
MISRNLKKIHCIIEKIPKPWKMPQENYNGPKEWHLKFPQPCQVKPRAFYDCPEDVQLGPSVEVDKEGEYKNTEYFSYHRLSYYNMEEDLSCMRTIPQPSPFKTKKCP